MHQDAGIDLAISITAHMETNSPKCFATAPCTTFKLTRSGPANLNCHRRICFLDSESRRFGGEKGPLRARLTTVLDDESFKFSTIIALPVRTPSILTLASSDYFRLR